MLAASRDCVGRCEGRLLAGSNSGSYLIVCGEVTCSLITQRSKDFIPSAKHIFEDTYRSRILEKPLRIRSYIQCKGLRITSNSLDSPGVFPSEKKGTSNIVLLILKSQIYNKCHS